MTLAGLNTINLSQINTFQQFILFLLIMIGSAIWVSVGVVHVRKKAFERRFKSLIEEERQKRRTRDRSNSRGRAFSFGRNFSQSRPEVDGVVVRGSVIGPEKDLGEDANGNVHIPSRKGPSQQQPADERNDGSNVPSRWASRSPAVDDSAQQGPPGQGLDEGSANIESHEPRAPDELLSINTGVTRRITFASPSTPTRRQEHGRLFAMQGIGARQHLLNHPLRTPPPIYADDVPKLHEGSANTAPAPRNGVYGFLVNGFIGRNSQFSSLTLAERDRLGGVEYRAVTILSFIVPLYFILWQLLGCIGLGWYIANNRTDATAVNAENPW